MLQMMKIGHKYISKKQASGYIGRIVVERVSGRFISDDNSNSDNATPILNMLVTLIGSVLSVFILLNNTGCIERPNADIKTTHSQVRAGTRPDAIIIEWISLCSY